MSDMPAETREFKALIDRLWKEIPSQYARTVEHSLKHLMRERDEAVRMSEWQDISTAPKDGTPVDLFGTRNGEPRRFTDAVWSEDCFGGMPLGEWSWHHPTRDVYGTFEYTHWAPIELPGEES